MLSRVAENLYWLGRYLERAENVARMIDVEYHAAVESGALAGRAGSTWDALIAATGAEAAYKAARAEGEVAPSDFLVLAEANPNSIRSLVVHARTAARGLREHVSREVWQELNTLHLTLGSRTHVYETDLFDLCNGVKRSIETIFGLYDNTVLFDDGREWFRCGFYLERADMTSRVLDTKYHMLLPEMSEVGGPLDRYQWTAILKSASAWEAFRKTSRRAPSGPRVADMLIFHPLFPRSLTFCVMALLRHYRNAAAQTPPPQRVPAERVLTLLQLDLAGLNIDAIVKQGLHEFLQSFQARLVEAHQQLADHIFRALPEEVAR